MPVSVWFNIFGLCLCGLFFLTEVIEEGRWTWWCSFASIGIAINAIAILT